MGNGVSFPDNTGGMEMTTNVRLGQRMRMPELTLQFPHTFL